MKENLGYNPEVQASKVELIKGTMGDEELLAELVAFAEKRGVKDFNLKSPEFSQIHREWLLNTETRSLGVNNEINSLLPDIQGELKTVLRTGDRQAAMKAIDDMTALLAKLKTGIESAK